MHSLIRWDAGQNKTVNISRRLRKKDEREERESFKKEGGEKKGKERECYRE